MPESSTQGAGGTAFRAGFVAIVGLPNVGKSTLLNAFLGERIGIVTHKAQTTRRRLLGICSRPSFQAVFIDTPGLLDPRNPLQRAMRAEALSTLDDADVVLAVVDAGFAPSVAWAEEFWKVAGGVRLLCLNKVDRVGSAEAGRLVERLRAGDWGEVYRTSADRGDGVGGLLEGIARRLPESPPLYPVDELSDAPVREFVAEMIRETCLEVLDEEVPYAVAVRVEEFRERGGDRPTYVEARLYVERESQKGIVVGGGGRTIRRIGSRSRGKIERFLEQRVFLRLRVKVLANWRRNTGHLRLLGFRVPSEEN